ncbi:MAG: hypothetical protein RBU37_11665 [Myxococcota bacterium]|jgi:hypothetical protein|nr:hypothetical protein [Myxococcota bacterium]
MRKRRTRPTAKPKSLLPTLLLMIVGLFFLLFFGKQLADRLAANLVAPPPQLGTEQLPPTLRDVAEDTAEEPSSPRTERPSPQQPPQHSGAVLREAIRDAAQIALQTLTR